jgi:hypothetical protein
VNISNEDGNATSVDVSLNAGASTATDPADFTYTSPTTVTFPANDNTPQTVTVTIVDDGAAEAIESLVLELSNATNSASIVADSVYTLTIIDDDALSIEFDTTTMTYDEAAGVITAQVNVSQAPATDTDVSFTATGTAIGGGTDYTITTSSPITFPSGSTAPQMISSTINDDALTESTETIILTLSAPTAGAFLGIDSVETISITDNDIPYCDIADLTSIDALGVADSLGVYCAVRGVVYGNNFRAAGSGLEFTLIDQTDGIGVFDFADDFGYTVAEGDSIELRGTIGQFNGLIQLDPDTLIFFTANNTLHAPLVVTTLDEVSESDLVQIDGVWLVDPLQWTGTGSGFNVDVTDGTNTYLMRIDAEVDLYSMPAPTGTFDLCGLGSQYDFSSPYDEGYQIFPRYNADIKIIVDLGPDVTACGDAVLDAGWADVVWNTSATTQTITVTVDGIYYVDASYGSVTASDTISVTLLPSLGPGITVDNEMPCVDNLDVVTFTGSGTGVTSWDWDFGDSNTSTQQNPSHTYTTPGVYTVTLIISDGVCTESTTFTIDAQICGGLGEFDANEISVYPTLNEGRFNVSLDLGQAQQVSLQLTDLQGRVVWADDLGTVSTSNTVVDVDDAASGVYFLTINGERQHSVVKLVIR